LNIPRTVVYSGTTLVHKFALCTLNILTLSFADWIRVTPSWIHKDFIDRFPVIDLSPC